MARVKFGMMMVDARGKLGGQVFSKNRAGAYIRTKVTPVNPQTAYQSSVRALFGAISQQWSGLTDVVRDGWNEAVSEWQTTDVFGDLKQPSGKALFQRLNNQAQAVGYTAVTAAPAKLEMVEGLLSEGVISISGSEVDITGYYNGPDARVVLYATAPLSQGTKFVKNKLRQVYVSLGNAYSSTAAYTAYVAKYGAPANGDNVYIGVKYVLPNGQASPLQTLKALVEA